MILDGAITGGIVFLRQATEEDARGAWWTWLNDPEVTARMNKGATANTEEAQVAFIRKMRASDADLVLAVCDLETGEHIGTTALHSIDQEAGSAQFGILIGNKKFWGRGAGGEAWKLLVGHGFDSLGLAMIHTTIFAENAASIRIAEKCGFKRVRTLKGDIIKDGVPRDRIYMELHRARRREPRGENS